MIALLSPTLIDEDASPLPATFALSVTIDKLQWPTVIAQVPPMYFPKLNPNCDRPVLLLSANTGSTTSAVKPSCGLALPVTAFHTAASKCLAAMYMNWKQRACKLRLAYIATSYVGNLIVCLPKPDHTRVK